MDPFSIATGVAGIATVGSALASKLFDIISTIRAAPREMIEIARGIRELSAVLKELRRILRHGRQIFQDRLYRSIGSVTGRIADVQEEIEGMLDEDSGGLSRVIWVFRKSKTTKLLAKIESHKSTVQLMATTMLLAIEERKHASRKARRSGDQSDDEDERENLRQDAETLVQATESAWKDLLPQKSQEDRGTQTAFESMSSELVMVGDNPFEPIQAPHTGATSNHQLERWDPSGEDTARWLYRLIFAQSQLSEQRSSESTLFQLDISNPVARNQVVGGLLRAWTEPTTDESDQKRASRSPGEDIAGGDGARDGLHPLFDISPPETPTNDKKARFNPVPEDGELNPRPLENILKAAHPVSPPPYRVSEQRPLKGILKNRNLFRDFPDPGGDRFGKNTNPSQERIPKDAKWTKISRKLVNPEALTIGKERFEVRDDFVIVLRVLDRQAIDTYKAITAEIRESRRRDAESEEVGRTQRPQQRPIYREDSWEDQQVVVN